MTYFYLLLGSLAVFRLSLLVSKEDGPAYVFRKIRRLPPPKTSARDGLACIFCVSIYMSALVTWYQWKLGWITVAETPLFWLAQSAVAIAINQTFTKGSL